MSDITIPFKGPPYTPETFGRAERALVMAHQVHGRPLADAGGSFSAAMGQVALLALGRHPDQRAERDAWIDAVAEAAKQTMIGYEEEP